MPDNPGDRSFERLYRRHARDVYRFVLAVVRNPTEAEDVTQTAFLNAYRAFQRGERPERPQSWLIAIAHNAIRSRHRFRLRRPKEVPFDEALLDLPVAAEERETVANVLEALGELPVHQREALAMRELEGRSYSEIAETLGVSVPAVESLIFRARRTLRARRANLRGLTVVPLPRSLRSLFETQPDAVSAGLAAKAAVVVATASVVAGGVLGSGDAGASQHPIALGRHEPSRPNFVATQPARTAIAAPQRRHAAVPARPRAATPPRVSRTATPPSTAAVPPAPATSAPPEVTISTTPPRAEAPPPAEPASEQPPATTVSTAAETVAAVTSTLPVPIPPPPALPQAPPLPSLPAPPPLPDPPGIPQVPGPNGIK